MSEIKKINEIISEVKKSNVMRSMPLGYSCGYPVIIVKQSRVCAVLPFLRYKVTGFVDKTEVYPVCFLVTYAIKDGVITAFEDLTENPVFENVDFGTPVGFFRHDSIKNLSKGEYKEKQAQLYSYYDSFIASLINKEEYPAEQLKEFRGLLSTLLEPSLKPFYEALYPSFYHTCVE